MTGAPQVQARRAKLTFALLFLFAVLAGIVWVGGASDFDSRVRDFVHAWASTSLTDAMRAVTVLGSIAVLAALFIVAFLGFYFARDRDSAWLVAWAMGGAIVLENGLKFAFQRARPEPYFGIVAPESFSFPSGHALSSACFYGAIAWLLAARAQKPMGRAALWTAALALIAAIGFSRVYLGVHNPTDVLAGYLVAAFWLSAIRLRASNHG